MRFSGLLTLSLAVAAGLACTPSATIITGGTSDAGGKDGGDPADTLGGGGGADAGTIGTGGGAGGGTGGGASASTDGGASIDGGASTDGGDAGTPRQAAEVLDGFAILKPCNGWNFSHQNNAGDCCCEETDANENQHITRQFGGDPSVTYLVKVRIAGVAERYWYSGGTLDQSSKLFYTGGLPTIHSAAAANNNLRPGQGACKIHPPDTDSQFKLPFSMPIEIRPSDGCYNGFNIFAMTVSSPKQSYYLNATTDFDGTDRQPHSAYKTDYTVTIAISGQAKLDFYTVDGDHHQVTNNGTMMVPNLKTDQPYNGNFLEFAVEEVTTQ